MTQLSVGKLAKAAGIKIESVRFYEKRGLLPEPNRLPSGYRIYSGETVKRIRFIKRAQELGFTLEEIANLLAITDNPNADCGDIRDQAEDKIADIKQRINDLNAMHAALSKLRKYCPGKGIPIADCSIVKYFYGS